MVDQANVDLQAFMQMPEDGEELVPHRTLWNYNKSNEIITTNSPIPSYQNIYSLKLHFFIHVEHSVYAVSPA